LIGDNSMSTATAEDLATTCRRIGESAKGASVELAILDATVKNRWLLKSADQLVESRDEIIAANKLDLEAAPGFGLTDAAIDRLRLDAGRIATIADGIRQIAVFFIYESRPNVTADAAAICVKSGNAVILRGGKEAFHSSSKLIELMNRSAKLCGIPDGSVQLVPTADRDAVGQFLKMNDLIDLTIPRGGEALIRRVAAEAKMPVIKHYDGNCHVYVDQVADIDMAVKVLINAKCQRMGVCNACESLLVHRDIAPTFLPQAAKALREQKVEMRVDARAANWITDGVPATEADFSTEYLGPILSIAIVDSLREACDHINRYGSHHTDAIITKSLRAAEEFTQRVDSSAVMVNASTRFNDGGVFGLGAEIGISTDKFHARGPCGLKELTSYKYIVRGDGHIRS
jgi:glutamate-5-semialdehyde dehydrogenase